MRYSKVVLICWLALVVILALHSSEVFSVLTYDESKLMPKDIEPMVVDSIVKSLVKEREEVHVLVVEGLNLEKSVAEVRKELKAQNFTVYDTWIIMDEVLEEYNRKVEGALRDAEFKAREEFFKVAKETRDLCEKLLNITSTLEGYEVKVKGLLNMTYGLSLIYLSYYNEELAKGEDEETASSNAMRLTLRKVPGKYVENASMFLSTFKEYISKGFDYREALIRATNYTFGESAVGIVESFDVGNWSSELSIRKFVLSKAGVNGSIPLVRSLEEARGLIYAYTVDKAPNLVRPYYGLLVCASNESVEYAVRRFVEDLYRNITSAHPPPTIDDVDAARRLVTSNYALVIALGSERPRVSLPNVYAVDTEAVIKDLRNILVKDVETIDRTTSLSLLLILLYVFGTLACPLFVLLALGLTYLASLGLLYLIVASGIFDIYYLSVYMVAPIIFGIGVDYSLLFLGRYVEERSKGIPHRKALEIAYDYGRRTILTSGSVVAVGLGSFALSPLKFMQSIGVANVVSVLMTLATTIFAVPSMLDVLKDWMFWPKRSEELKVHEARGRLLANWASFSIRHAKAVVLIATVASALVAVYVLQTVKITTNPVVTMPEVPSKKGIEIVYRYFNSTSLSKTHVVLFNADWQEVNETASKILKIPYVTKVEILFHNSTITLLEVESYLSDLADQQLDLYRELKSIGDMLVGGSAGFKNVVFQLIFVYFWNVQAAVIAVASMLVLIPLIRSLLIPARLIATVLMSVAWSMLLTIVVFEEALGKETYWIMPIVLYSLLVSVGTDYDIFIVSRVREELSKGASDEDAILTSITTTGPVVTSAALILATAFSTLMLSNILILQEVGFGVAIAVLIDAFIMRPIVVPAIFVLMRRYNWWPFLRS